ncbi:MAG: metallophosphoesterase [Solirubrobacteraceae bacterium]
MRTLVVSDLHLGSPAGVDVLRREQALAALMPEVFRCDRLVLLGDVLELRQGPVRDALSAAEPVLREIGAALGPGSEAVIVPGNHDHHLAAAWLARCARDAEPAPLGLESAVDWEQEETLGTVASWLEPARVRAAYPGVWLRDDVYAIHGHYADRHTTVPMFERLGAGAMARLVRDSADGPARAEDYEAVLAPIYAWIHAVAQNRTSAVRRGTDGASSRAWRTLSSEGRGRRSPRRTALKLAFPAAVAGLNCAGLGPLRADISGAELRKAGLLALATTLRRLGVRAPHVIFGHTHRAGPLPSDDGFEWRTPEGSSLTNTGCWVYERVYLGRDPSNSPYRPGFCAALDDAGPPVLSNLLDGAVAFDKLRSSTQTERMSR